jgi:hypothetical protein
MLTSLLWLESLPFFIHVLVGVSAVDGVSLLLTSLSKKQTNKVRKLCIILFFALFSFLFTCFSAFCFSSFLFFFSL